MPRTALSLCLALVACSKPPPPPTGAPVRIGELLVQMTRQADEHPGHGTYHRARNDLERELWGLLRVLPIVEKGDELLLLCVENVYTRYDANYLNGYLWHWPYLNSRRAIALCDRILKDWPRTQVRERTLWLKAFALVCPPTLPDPAAEKDLDVYRDQATWRPDPEAARALYREIAAMNGTHAKKARELADSSLPVLVLPMEPLQPDPRSP